MDNLLQPMSVYFRKGIELLAVHIQNSQRIIFLIEKRNDDFGLGSLVTSDVVQKFMDIWNHV